MTTTIEQHLISRRTDLALHTPITNEEDSCATFLLWNLSGQLVGFQQYRPYCVKARNNHPRGMRYFTYRSGSTLGLFGIESLHLTPNVVFVTEGVFDATRLTSLGVSAIAVLSNDPAKEVSNFLRSLARKVVVVCDNDSAGRKLAKFGDYIEYTSDKDLGESSDEFVESLVKKYVKRIVV